MSVVIAVPDDKVTLSHWRQAHTDLAEGANEGLRIATDAFMQRRDADLLESRWLRGANDLGEKGYEVYYRVGYPGYEVAYYDYDFIRGLVYVAVLFTLDESTDLSQETYAIMAGIDDTVGQRLRVLSDPAEVQAETQN